MALRIGINGFGRIGRLVYRAMQLRPDRFEVVAVNDLPLDRPKSDAPTDKAAVMKTHVQRLAHLLRYDTVFGRFNGSVEARDEALVVDGRSTRVLAESNPAKLPWKDLEVDWVVESTGAFTGKKKCEPHLQAGAKRVLVSAPTEKDDLADATVVLGVNHQTVKPEHKVISNASCTTNCLAPVAKVLNDSFGVVRGLMTTVHAYTNDQRTADQVHKDLRRARAAGQNVIPTSTGAAKAIGLVIPDLSGKMDGMAMRVPVADGSVVDLVVELRQKATKEQVNAAFKAAATGSLKGILEYTEDPIVSGDVIGNEHSAVFDAPSTMLVGDTFVKVVAWYDNEWAYSRRCADVIHYLSTRAWPL